MNKIFPRLFFFIGNKIFPRLPQNIYIWKFRSNVDIIIENVQDHRRQFLFTNIKYKGEP